MPKTPRKPVFPKITFPKIVFVNSEGGDWEGIYVDGKLLREDHSLAPDDVLSVLGIESPTDTQARRACAAVCERCRAFSPVRAAVDKNGNPYGPKVWHLEGDHLHRCKAEDIRKEFRR